MKGRWSLLALISVGLLLGMGLGLLYAWVIRPVTYVDTAPVALRADFKDQFRAVIAAAYAANGNLPRARARLALLGDLAPASALREQSRRAAGPGGSVESALALAQLAEALSPAETPTPSMTPTLQVTTSTNTPGITRTPRAGRTPTPPTKTPTPTRTARPTLTPRPSPSPTATPGRPFELVGSEDICDEEERPGLLQVTVKDAQGQEVAGAEIIISWQGGQESFFTGLKPQLGDGYADYLMQEGITYNLRLGLESETAEGLSIPPCDVEGGAPFDGGISLVFQQP